MKCLIVLLALCAVSLASKNHHRQYHEFHRECMKEAGVDYKDKEDPKYKCVSNCVYTKMHIISADGKLNVTSYPENMQDKAKSCFEPNKDLEACERASKYGNCVGAAMQEKWNEKIQKCSSDTKTKVTATSKKELWKIMMDEKHACFGRCMLSQMKLIDENNDINMDTVNIFAANDSKLNIEEIVEKCNKEHSYPDACVQVAKRVGCVFKALKKVHKE